MIFSIDIKKKSFIMIRSRSEQKFRHVVLKVPIFSTEVQIKTGISRDGVGESKKSSTGKYGYFLE